MKNRRRPMRTGIHILLGLLIGLGFARVVPTGATNTPEDSLRELKVFTEAYHIVRSDFADSNMVEPHALIEGAIRGMIGTLGDPHTRYLPVRQANELMVETEGEFGGLGIVITVSDGLLSIVSPIEGTPAWENGVEAGDIITHIEGDSTTYLDIHEAVELLRGPVGTDVTITISRPGLDEPFDLTITRAVIRIDSVKQTMLDDDIAYLRISSFTDRTASELDDALEALMPQSPRAMILDLRGNPGGVLNAAVAVSDRFLDSGPIVEVRSRIPRQTRTYLASRSTTIRRIPLVVLVDSGSASASEIVSGAIQDSERGIIVGTQTFGKGSVQTVESISDGSKLAITTARYFTPSGRSIHGIGITPDIRIEIPRLSKEDQEALVTIQERHILRDFVQGMDDYDEDDLARLRLIVESEGIEISDNALERGLAAAISRANAMGLHIFPGIDPQLSEAIRLLHASSILSSSENR